VTATDGGRWSGQIQWFRSLQHLLKSWCDGCERTHEHGILQTAKNPFRAGITPDKNGYTEAVPGFFC
jgi:hypothetical protein